MNITIKNMNDYIQNKNGLLNWNNKLTNLVTGETSGKLNICAIGDSITEGLFAGRTDSLNFSSYMANGYLGMLRSYFMDNLELDWTGRGFIPYRFGEIWTYSGTWNSTDLYPPTDGPGLCGGITIGSTDATATISFNGTEITFYGLINESNNFTIAVDGESVEFTETQKTPYGLYTVSGLTDGPHTAVLTVTGNSMGLVGACETKGSDGVVVNGLGRGMNDSNGFVLDDTLSFIFDCFTPDLTIISLLSNDFAHTTFHNYESNISTLIEHAQLTGDVLLTSVGVNSPYVFVRDHQQSEYIAILESLVREYDVAFCDVYKFWGNSFDNALLTNYLADGVTHPNIQGHYSIFDCIRRSIIPSSLRKDYKGDFRIIKR